MSPLQGELDARGARYGMDTPPFGGIGVMQALF